MCESEQTLSQTDNRAVTLDSETVNENDCDP